MTATPKLPDVLLVEDDHDIASLYSERLKVAKLDVEVINNGKQALDRLQAATTWPPVLLLDIMLPGLSGFDILEAIKDDPRHAKMSVVILTAYADADRQLKAHELGYDDYFVKTQIKPSELADLVLKKLKK